MQWEILSRKEVAALLPRCSQDVNKYTRGAVAVFGGCSLYGGAPLLCGTSALYAGAGIVTVCVPKDSVANFPGRCASALIFRYVDSPCFTEKEIECAREILPRYQTLAVGPGMGREEESWRFMKILLAEGCFRDAVLDADALTLLAEHKEEFLNCLSAECRCRLVLTPHDGEFARLRGMQISRESLEERVAGTVGLARDLGCTVLRKGADTVVASPGGRATLCQNGCPALATAGSGDVLTGTIAALLAAGMAPHEAASVAAWCHGQAGRQLAGKTGRFGFVADDLPKEIARVLAEME